MTRLRWIGRRVLSVGLLLALSCGASGCVALGALVSKLPAPPIAAAYKGLAGQPTAIMVFVDQGVLIDWPTLPLDTANSLQSKLLAAAATAKDVKDISFPYRNDSIVRWQREHPGWPAEPITEIAPRFGKITRLIYVEYASFATRSPASIELYRGHARVSVRVVEVADGKARVAFEENNIQVSFPPNAPADGTPSGTDVKMYVGTVDAVTFELLLRFTEHSGDAR